MLGPQGKHVRYSDEWEKGHLPLFLQLLVGLAGEEAADVSLHPGDDPGQFVITHLFKDTQGTGLEEDLWRTVREQTKTLIVGSTK